MLSDLAVLALSSPSPVWLGIWCLFRECTQDWTPGNSRKAPRSRLLVLFVRRARLSLWGRVRSPRKANAGSVGSRHLVKFLWREGPRRVDRAEGTHAGPEPCLPSILRTTSMARTADSRDIAPSPNAVKENSPHFPGSINPPSDQDFCPSLLLSTSSSTNRFHRATLIHSVLDPTTKISADCRTCHDELGEMGPECWIGGCPGEREWTSRAANCEAMCASQCLTTLEWSVAGCL